jgi:hypothetical protein
MQKLDFVKLCESVINELELISEADYATLKEIERQADGFRKQIRTAQTPKEKQDIVLQMRTLKSFLIDELNDNKPEDQKLKTDEEVDSAIYQSGLYGLRHLLSSIIGKML